MTNETSATAVSTHPNLLRHPDGTLWFTEKGVLWPGQAMSIQVNSVLCHEKSKYQDVLMMESTNYGRMLVLDGVIQCTERDEMS
jgi:spermidine synthase